MVFGILAVADSVGSLLDASITPRLLETLGNDSLVISFIKVKPLTLKVYNVGIFVFRGWAFPVPFSESL